MKNLLKISICFLFLFENGIKSLTFNTEKLIDNDHGRRKMIDSEIYILDEELNYEKRLKTRYSIELDIFMKRYLVGNRDRRGPRWQRFLAMLKRMKNKKN